MFEPLDRESVISSVDDKPLLFNQRTLAVIEMLDKLSKNVRDLEQWYVGGVECKVMIPGKGWVQGKVRFSLEFEPDELAKDSELDKIRKLSEG